MFGRVGLTLVHAHEQARFKKSDVFNLEEDDLTHMGTSLSNIDDFGDDFADSSEDDGTGAAAAHYDATVHLISHFCTI